MTAIATPTTTETFHVTYKVEVYYSLQVERPSDITADDLIASITRDEISNAEEDCDSAWDCLKDAWKDRSVVRLENEQGTDLLDA